MSVSNCKCGYAWPGTYGHECGKPATVAASKPSTYTANGIFWAARCDECKDLTGPDNQGGYGKWEPLDLTRHVNEWR